MKFDVVIKQIKGDCLRPILSEIYLNGENICCFTGDLKSPLTLACIRAFTNGFGSKVVC